MSYIGYPYVTDQAYNLEFEGQYVKIPNGTTAQRSDIPVAEAGMFRFNTTENTFEGYDGSEWGSIGGSYEVSYTTLDSTVHTIYLSALPFYLSNGNFSPICLKAGVIPFLLADGVTEIEYKVN
jgi:hypothetical protein